MFENEIRIRLAEEGLAFIYSIVQGGMLIETGVVNPIEEESEDVVAPGYYGGSQAMD